MRLFASCKRQPNAQVCLVFFVEDYQQDDNIESMQIMETTGLATLVVQRAQEMFHRSISMFTVTGSIE